MRTRTFSKGITLVELLVSSAVAVVLGVAVITIFLLFTRETRESAAFTRMQMQYDNLIEQIARDVRTADRVLQNSDPAWTVVPPILAPDTTHSINLYDANGTMFKAYSVENNKVTETDAGGTQDFNAGNGIIEVIGDGCGFFLYQDRTQVGISLTLKTTIRNEKGVDTTYYLPPRRDVILCRRYY